MCDNPDVWLTGFYTCTETLTSRLHTPSMIERELSPLMYQASDRLAG